jgi:hypothetical protein
MILQLNPPLHVVTPKGEAWARLVIDYGLDHNTIYVCDLFEDRSTLHVDSEELYWGGNTMYNLHHPEPPKERQI